MSEIKCTFCGKDSEDESCLCLIASPNKTYICDECVDLARDIVGFYRGKDTLINNKQGEK